MAKGVTFNEMQGEAARPILMSQIVKAAMELFAQGVAVEMVLVSPAYYVDLVTELGREVNFQELYGKTVIEFSGLFLRVRQEKVDGEPWGNTAFELLTAEMMTDSLVREETLIQKIVRTWESCDRQCERGFACPLLVEIGTDLNGEVTDACTALGHIEMHLGTDEGALRDAAERFKMDAAQDAQDEQENQDGLRGGEGVAG